MTINKLLILVFSGPIALLLLLTVINFILKKLKPDSEEDFRLRTAYGIYFGGILVAGIVIQVNVMAYVNEAADIIQKTAAGSIFEMAKTAILFIGLGIVWFILLHVLTGIFTAVFSGIKREPEEMLLGNTYYFVIKSLIFIGIAILMTPGFSLVLRWLMPNVPTAFIH